MRSDPVSQLMRIASQVQYWSTQKKHQDTGPKHRACRGKEDPRGAICSGQMSLPTDDKRIGAIPNLCQSSQATQLIHEIGNNARERRSPRCGPCG